MKYISIDIETTGLNPLTCNTLSIGAIIEDTNNPVPYEELPKFHVAILHEELQGSPYAINMNRDLIETIVQYQTAKDQDEKNDLVQMTGMQFLKLNEVAQSFNDFLYQNGMIEFNLNEHVRHVNGKMLPMIGMKTKPTTITAAGKNFGTFDKLFLEQIPQWNQVVKFRSRIIDPSILFVDWKNDNQLPSLNECKERANVPGIVTHNALEDAWDVIQTLRTKY
jgi:DNA polymerase III epsilon subunit-like protein